MMLIVHHSVVMNPIIIKNSANVTMSEPRRRVVLSSIHRCFL